MNEIFLKQNKSKKSVGVDNFINMELSTNSRLLPVSEVNDDINSYEVYVNEKDASDIYRLIFTIDPICTNVLFNAYSEIVCNEGSSACTVVTNNGVVGNTGFLNEYNTYTGRRTFNKNVFIQDTGYSDKSVGPFVYHCGIDIFNNHHLRRKTFSVVNKLKTGNSNFNTLSDDLRDSAGNVVNEKILKINETNSNLFNTDFPLHLYRVDSVETYKKTVQQKLREENGWVGFNNPTSLNVPNYYSGISLNKCMNNNKADEFIDMYPDRSLYSFIPKYNKYRNRMENNWDYCITYPYSSYTNNSLVQYAGRNVVEANGICCRVIDSCNLSGTILDNNGKEENKIVYFRSQIRNSFTNGSFINISVFDTSSNKYATSDTAIKIAALGYLNEDTNHIFGIKIWDLYKVISLLGSNFIDENGHLLSRYEIRVRKYENGTDCQYYIRKFKKLGEFNSSLNRLAYGENIYSDKMAQIVFNDDIVTTGFRDNLGRELSEVYLTIIKRNAGHNAWYSGDYNNENVEFSHCFGYVSAGFDLPVEESNYNIHKIHNVRSKSVISASPTKLKEDITIDSEDFDGDIVEFSPYLLEETVLEKVYHRFNTAQREQTSTVFGGGVNYQEIVSDDYDISANFAVSSYVLNNNSNIHLNPEGYYYQPHYRIGIKEFNQIVNQGSHIKMALSDIVKNGNVYYANTAVNYYLNAGDKIYFYKKFTHEKVVGEIKSVSGKNFTQISFMVSGIQDFSEYFAYKINPEMPTVAYELNDGTGRYLWRDKKSDKDMMPGDELYDSVFTNGAHYFHQNINFFVRRQDPTGEYGLNVVSRLDAFTGFGCKIKEVSKAEYVKEGEGTIC